MITKVNPYGHISLTNDYFSGLVEQAAKQCYGIAAMGQAPAESVVRSALRTGSLPPKGVTVTQEGADDPIESTPANRIMRIDSRQQTIRNSGDSDPERWTSTSRFTYDDAGRLTCYEWDDSPENSADAMDEVLRISYPDAKTLKLSAETTESPET